MRFIVAKDNCWKYSRNVVGTAVDRGRRRLKASRGPLRDATVPLAVVLTLVATGGWAAAASTSDDAGRAYYVSVGDSYASGYQPPDSGAATGHDGFADQVDAALSKRGATVDLVNFGCSGQTAYGMAFDPGCAKDSRAAGGPDYAGVPQAVAALRFIADHPGKVKLVTIAAGANDLMPCIDEKGPGVAQSCAEAAVPRITLSLSSYLSKLREAVGDSVPIVGLSYINVFIAEVLRSGPAGEQRAATATALFNDYLNPALSQTYSQYGAQFVDITDRAGGNLPGTEKTYLAPYGTVTASIARVCALTYFCATGDPHPNRAGHSLIAREILRVLGP